MAVYKINQESIEALLSTVEALSEAAESLDSASSILVFSVREYEDTIGPHVQSVISSIEGIQTSLKTAVGMY